MSFTYNGDHSIMFIKADNSVDYASLTKSSIEDYYDTWDSLHLIPESRPLINTPQPSISLYPDSATSKLIDLTDKVAGGQLFGPRQGEWTFIVDHDRWSSWYEARKMIEKILNGQKLYCILNDDPNTVYYGCFVLNGWNDGDQFSTVTIGYDLNYTKYANRFSSFLATNIRMALRSTAPVVYVGDPIAKIGDYAIVSKTYLDGTDVTASVDSSFIEGANDGSWFNSSGENVVTVHYGDRTYPLNVTVDSASLSFIEVSVSEYASPIIVGDNKSSVLSRLIVYATYSDGSRKSVDSRHCNVDSGVFSTYGTIPVNVRYGNKSATVNVTVITISGITATLDSSMEGRIVGDLIESSYTYDYIHITGIYTDQSTFAISSNPADGRISYSPTRFTQIGTTTLTITYLNTYTTTLSIPVYAISSMGSSLKQQALRLFVGMNLDLNTFYYWTQYSADLYFVLSNGTRRHDITFSLPNDYSSLLQTSGNKTMTLTSNNYSTNLSINVENVSITSITATTNSWFNSLYDHVVTSLTKAAYVWQYLDYTITYSDGRTQIIHTTDENGNLIPHVTDVTGLIFFVHGEEGKYDNSFGTAGTHTLQLTYLKCFTFNVTVQVYSS